VSLHKEMLEAGLVIGHHESDLYVRNCPEAWEILSRHPIAKANAQRFVSEGWAVPGHPLHVRKGAWRWTVKQRTTS